MSERLMLIADDLTGALDAAVQFCGAGVSTFVALHGEAWPTAVDAAVIAVDIESRHLPCREAGVRVRRCVEEARRAGVQRFYKKTDSTLRGNVGAELEALLRATGREELYFVPALPDAGRVTRAGVQYVDGLPLHRSAYANDPQEPVREASIAAIIGSQAVVTVVGVPRGAEPAARLAGARRPAILVFDAETSDDLQAIAGRLAVLGPPALFAGCASFAGMLPDLLGLDRTAVPRPAPRSPLLVVCGSLNGVSRTQVSHAEARGVPCWRRAPRGAETAVADALHSRGSAILVTDGTAAAGELVRRVLDQVDLGTLAVFGGDTAYAVAQMLGARGLWPLGEVCQGVVVSRLEGGPGGAPSTGMHLVTKAGGFGPIDVIERIRGALDREE